MKLKLDHMFLSTKKDRENDVCQKKKKAELRRKISDDVEKFLSSGGKIQVISSSHARAAREERDNRFCNENRKYWDTAGKNSAAARRRYN